MTSPFTLEERQSMILKSVYLDDIKLAMRARTTLEAARIAQAAGASFNLRDRGRHIAEGPQAFYVSRSPQ